MDEFLIAVTISSVEDIGLSKETLLTLCFNFVVYDGNVNFFRFAHFSVREYLESKTNYEVFPQSCQNCSRLSFVLDCLTANTLL